MPGARIYWQGSEAPRDAEDPGHVLADRRGDGDGGASLAEELVC